MDEPCGGSGQLEKCCWSCSHSSPFRCQFFCLTLTLMMYIISFAHSAVYSSAWCSSLPRCPFASLLRRCSISPLSSFRPLPARAVSTRHLLSHSTYLIHLRHSPPLSLLRHRLSPARSSVSFDVYAEGYPKRPSVHWKLWL